MAEAADDSKQTGAEAEQAAVEPVVADKAKSAGEFEAVRDLIPGLSKAPGLDKGKFIRGVKRESACSDFKQAMPCKGAWTAMPSAQRVSPCSKCKLLVYDFTGLTPEECKQLILQHEGLEKVTLFRRADGKFLTSDCPAGSKDKLSVAILSLVGLLIVTGILALATMAPKPKPQSISAVPTLLGATVDKNAAEKVKVIPPGQLPTLTPAEEKVLTAAAAKIKVIPPGQPKVLTAEEEKTLKTAAAKIKIVRPAVDYSLRSGMPKTVTQTASPELGNTNMPPATPANQPDANITSGTAAGSETPEPTAADSGSTSQPKPEAAISKPPATPPAEIPATPAGPETLPAQSAAGKHNPYVRDYR